MFWSVIVYDNEIHFQITRELVRPLVGSVHGTKPNKDGSSYDIYLGPKLPSGIPKENRGQTKTELVRLSASLRTGAAMVRQNLDSGGGKEDKKRSLTYKVTCV